MATGQVSRRTFETISKSGLYHHRNGSYAVGCENGSWSRGELLPGGGGVSCRLEELEVGEFRREVEFNHRSVAVKESEKGVLLSSKRKQKFSPIKWDIKAVKVSSSNRYASYVGGENSYASKGDLVPSCGGFSCRAEAGKLHKKEPSSCIKGSDKRVEVPPKKKQKVSLLENQISQPNCTLYSYLSPPSSSFQSGEVVARFAISNEERETAAVTTKSELSFPEMSKELPHVNPEQELAKVHDIGTSRWASNIGYMSDFDDEDTVQDNLEISHDNTLGANSTPESGEFCGKYSETSERDCSSVSMGTYGDFIDIDDAGTGVSAVGLVEMNNAETGLVEGTSSGSINMFQASRSVFEYEKLNKINEGTYGIVYRSRDKKTGQIMALKKLKILKDDAEEGFSMASLREIDILMSFHHPSIVNVKEVVTDNFDDVFMVMEYMEHDLKAVMEVMKQPFSTSEVKCLMRQLLEGVHYLHDNWVVHRDLKTSNILFNNKGELKICDFGMSRRYGSPSKTYTQNVVTQWYRAPELLLGTKKYSTAVDMWSVGCIMAEMLSKEPLFPGTSEIDQLNKIFRTLGTPNETSWPGLSLLPKFKCNFVNQTHNTLRKKFPVASFTASPILSDSGLDLLNKLLACDPEKRISAEDALHHRWFEEVPLPKSKDFMPTFPPVNARNSYEVGNKHRWYIFSMFWLDSGMVFAACLSKL